MKSAGTVVVLRSPNGTTFGGSRPVAHSMDSDIPPLAARCAAAGSASEQRASGAMSPAAASPHLQVDQRQASVPTSVSVLESEWASAWESALVLESAWASELASR